MSLTQDYTGRCEYQVLDLPSGRVNVGVLCLLGEEGLDTVAMLDTGADLCLIPTEMARGLGLETSPDPTIPPKQQHKIVTPGGLVGGRWHNLNVFIPADEGEGLEIDMGCLAAEFWEGPVVLGWQSALRVVAIALDPETQQLFFRKAG